MAANRQLKRHHACHECRTKKLRCSGDRPVCDGCKRKQDNHAASGSHRPVPECTYDFAPGEEVWVHWSGDRPNVTSRSIGKRTPSPPSDYKSRRPRTPTKQPKGTSQLSKTMQRPVKSPESPLWPAGLPEIPSHTDLFMAHFSLCNTFLDPELPYTPNSSVSLNGLSHNAALEMDHMTNGSFLAPGSHVQYLQAPAGIHNPEVTTNEYIHSTMSYQSSLPSITLLSNDMLRWY